MRALLVSNSAWSSPRCALVSAAMPTVPSSVPPSSSHPLIWLHLLSTCSLPASATPKLMPHPARHTTSPPAIGPRLRGMGGFCVHGGVWTWQRRGGAMHMWPGSVNGATQFAGLVTPWRLSADSTMPWRRESRSEGRGGRSWSLGATSAVSMTTCSWSSAVTHIASSSSDDSECETMHHGNALDEGAIPSPVTPIWSVIHRKGEAEHPQWMNGMQHVISGLF